MFSTISLQDIHCTVALCREFHVMRVAAFQSAAVTLPPWFAYEPTPIGPLHVQMNLSNIIAFAIQSILLRLFCVA